MFLFFCKKFSVGREFFLSPTLNIIQPKFAMDVAILHFIPFHKHYPCLKIPGCIIFHIFDSTSF